MLKLEAKSDLEVLHTDNIKEGLHLEYKASPAIDKKDDARKIEMARDVSAFANADGGQIIYGMTEVDHEPAGLDSGVDPKLYPEIWFEQWLNVNGSSRFQSTTERCNRSVEKEPLHQRSRSGPVLPVGSAIHYLLRRERYFVGERADTRWRFAICEVVRTIAGCQCQLRVSGSAVGAAFLERTLCR